MAISLDHTIVPAHDKAAAARFFAGIFGLEVSPPMGPFAPVRVNDGLTLDFQDRERFEWHHYAFHVDDADFDEILEPSRPRASPTAAVLTRWRTERSTIATAVAASTSGIPTDTCWSC
jgi:catechol 2,3-dioxygenase-like lactoylglutathione lyase family enzyme